MYKMDGQAALIYPDGFIIQEGYKAEEEHLPISKAFKLQFAPRQCLLLSLGNQEALKELANLLVLVHVEDSRDI